MMIPSSPSVASSSPASTGKAAANAPSNGVANGGFAAILTDAAAGTGTTETPPAGPTAAAKAAPVVASESGDPGDPGKATGKALPGVAAATLVKDIKTASGEAEDADAQSDTPPDSPDGAEIDPADTLLAVLAVLPPVTLDPAKTPATGASVNTIAVSSATASGPAIQSPLTVVTQQSVAPPDVLPAKADAGQDSGAGANTPASVVPMKVGVPASLEQVRLAPIEVAPANSPTSQTVKVPAAATPLSATATGESLPDAQPKAAPQAQTATAMPTPPAANTAAGVPPPPPVNDPAAPQTRVAASVAEQSAVPGERGSAPADRQAEVPTLVRVASNEAAPLAQPFAAPHLAATTTPVATPGNAAPQDSVPGPQDFATLVGKITEAREAAGAQVVRTAINHTQFGSVSLQFRPDSSGLSVTMASADPAFGTAVHAGVAASLAGQMSSDQGDAARGDARQAWQQPGSGSPAHTGGSFSQDQRQASAQSGNPSGTLAGGHDGDRRHAPAARGGTSAAAGDDGAARSARPDRGGIYA
ncbi:hypothetical protein WBP06_14150 [Novosphingobium sp. BL-8H]|uniref:hypothetical protein n=1 Tax=Novosphingobium sp. BL-8H TaxID=3127640 RepID=UPI003757DF47